MKGERFYLSLSIGTLLTVMGLLLFVPNSKNRVLSANQNLEKEAKAINQQLDVAPPKPLPAFPVGTTEERAAYSKPVPILMFHHIRNFYDPKNLIDTNLSTPTQNFKNDIDWLKANGYNTISFSQLFNGDVPEKPIILTFDDGYNDNYDAYKELAANNQKGTFFIISAALGGKSYLSDAQIKEMSDNGMEIESHTVNHFDLKTLHGDNLRNQLVISKNTLENITGKKVDYFCYPSGQYNPETVQAVAAAGYKAAVTVSPTTINNNLFTLPRVRMNPGDTPEILNKKINYYLWANGQYNWQFK